MNKLTLWTIFEFRELLYRQAPFYHSQLCHVKLEADDTLTGYTISLFVTVPVSLGNAVLCKNKDKIRWIIYRKQFNTKCTICESLLMIYLSWQRDTCCEISWYSFEVGSICCTCSVMWQENSLFSTSSTCLDIRSR